MKKKKEEDIYFGSEGICSHCKHQFTCFGSTTQIDPVFGTIGQTASRQSCGGGTTYAPACSIGDPSLDIAYGIMAHTIEHESFEPMDDTVDVNKIVEERKKGHREMVQGMLDRS